MRNMFKVARRATFIAAVVGAVAACNDFLTVDNPNVVDANLIDPVTSASTLAFSAQEDLAYAYGRYIQWGGWFTGEIEASDINYPQNTFAFRRVDSSMTYVDYPHPLGLAAFSSYYEQPLRARTSAVRLLAALKGTEGEDSNVSVARAAMVAGYAFLMTAHHMCVGTVDGGPALSTAALLDSSVAHFARAVAVAEANGSTTARTLRNAALVGRARAHLQVGANALALADAQAVDQGFTFLLRYSDDPANRNRLGNYVWHHTQLGTVSVAPPFRGGNDPRVPVKSPGQHSVFPNDGVTVMSLQDKYRNYASSIRLASKLEADYIAAEVTGTQAMLTLIDQRRAANGLPSYAGPIDDASVLREFMDQRGWEFWLEARRMGDFRRQPAAVQFVPQAGTVYRKPAYGTIGDQTCWPLPLKEVNNNPNLHPGG